MWGRSPPPTPPARVPSTEGNIQEQSDVLVAESALLSARMIGFSKKQHEERRLICLSGTGILIVAMGNVIDVEHPSLCCITSRWNHWRIWSREAHLELLLPCLNQFDKVENKISWNLEFK
jgi:hypothetical protein